MEVNCQFLLIFDKQPIRLVPKSISNNQTWVALWYSETFVFYHIYEHFKYIFFSTINPHINIFQNSNIFRKGHNWGELGATAHSALGSRQNLHGKLAYLLVLCNSAKIFIPPIHCNATKQQYCKWGSHILWELRVKLALLTMIFYYIKNLLVNFSWFYECCYKKLSFCSCMKVFFILW